MDTRSGLAVRAWEVGAVVLLGAAVGLAQLQPPAPASRPAQLDPAAAEREEYQARMKIPQEFARLRWAHGLSYKKTRELFTQQHLNDFYPLLNDPAYRSYWPSIVFIIAFIGPGEDRSIPILMEYCMRQEEWRQFGEVGRANDVYGKFHVLRALGFIGGETAEAVLKHALTPEGAADIARNWIESPPPFHYAGKRQEVIELIQSNAAMGLVYLRKPENMPAIEAIYQRFEADPGLLRTQPQLYNGIVSALGMRDYLAEVGMDEYLSYWGEGLGYFEKLAPHLRKYDNPVRQRAAAGATTLPR